MKSFLITCSHATCAIPEAQRQLFKGSEDLVSSVEGWEPGSLNLAQGLAMKLSTPLIHGEVSRLLIDLEEEGDKRWSKISGKLPEATREKLVDRHQKKFRQAIQLKIIEDLKRYESITHLIIHTAPIADGKILFEHNSSAYAKKLSDAAVAELPSSEVDASSQAIGTKSSLIRWAELISPDGKYDFIRITVSQSFFMKSVPMRWETIKRSLIRAVSVSV
ncbi:hypothetical protein [Luteolibacter sp. AS25]|uniref:hypothetical protein n=1 Tax=Luteolibacter sp. AS25 TaxID=3135776 RepID=UPI00398B466C